MSQYSEPLEREYQDKIVRLFTEELHYAYLGCLQYPKGKSQTIDGQRNTPIREDDLRAFLTAQKQADGTARYTAMQIEGAIDELRHTAQLPRWHKDALLDTNDAVYRLMTFHADIKPAPDKNEEAVFFFDFENIQANRFAIAEEVSYIDHFTGQNARPDLVVYVNGIALAVIELKRSTVSLEEGIRQCLSNEQDLIPSFFTTTQFTVAASDKNGFEYGTIGTARRFWCPWKKDGSIVGKEKMEIGDNPPLGDMEAFRAFFHKQTFMTMFRYGVICDGGIKKVMRPHQHYALCAAMPRLRDKADGVIWHSQGSGKSLTMVWLAKYIRKNFPDPRVLIITDRTELDGQIESGFLNTNEAIHRTSSSDDLLDCLSEGEEWLICSLIHKFGRHIDPKTKQEVIGDDDAPIPMEQYLDELRGLVQSKYGGHFSAKGTNKFVFVDECHRTQSGRLHEAMRLIMGEDVMFIGFTGTPLLREQKRKGGFAEYKKAKNTSQERFGEFIHTYLHKEAVRDKVILDLSYESRDVEQAVTSQTVLDTRFNELVANIPADQREEKKDKLEERWATLEKVYSSQDRIQRIGWSIIDDMGREPLCEDWCNAMLVAGNIYSAYKYYEFFQNNTPLTGKCAVVTSFEPSSYDQRKQTTDMNERQEVQFKHDMAEQSFKDMGVENAEDYEKEAKRRFKKQPGRMKLLIVVDKLLTGFDAPSATCLYIDKDMRDHNLFQAICRVNRLGEDIKDGEQTIISHKDFGRIVDFKMLFNKIEDAVHTFNGAGSGFAGFDEGEVDGMLTDLVALGKKRLDTAVEAYEALLADWARLGLTDNEKVGNYYATKERTAERKAIYKILGALIVAYANIADYIIKAGYSKAEAERIHKQASDAAATRKIMEIKSGDQFDVHEYDPRMRALLDRFIRAEEALVIIPPTTDFSFLDLITQDSDTEEVAEKATRTAGSEKGAAETIAGKVRRVINNYSEKDAVLARTFAEKLKDLLQQAQEDKIKTAELIRQLIDMIKESHAGEVLPEGITTKFGGVLYRNRADWTSLTDEKALIALIRKIEVFFEEDAGADWEQLNSSDYHICILDLTEIVGAHCTAEQIKEIHRLAANNL